MEFAQLLNDIQNKSIEKKTVAEQVVEQPSLIPELIDALADKKPAIRYGCAKVLHLLSESHPALLYPHFDAFVDLLQNGNNIMQAEGLYVISHLAEVDTENRVDAIVENYLEPIKGPTLMVAANAIQGGSRIALAKPNHADRIAEAILSVSEAKYKTEECVCVASGAAVESLDAFTHLVSDVRPIRSFMQAQMHSTRKGTRTKAEKVLRKRGW